MVGRVLRYVAEYRGQWVALLVFSSPAFHIKLRDQWLQWSPRQVKERRHLIAQNARFLVLAAPGQWPNLASRVLKLACERWPQDWQEPFGYPVRVVETFVDPLRFRGTCYEAAGWQPLGLTQGYERDWQDFYTDTRHPKLQNDCRNWDAVTGASKMGNTITGIAPRTRTAVRCITPLRRAISPCFGLWPSFCSSSNPRAKTAKGRCPTLSATLTARLLGADSPLHPTPA